MERTEIEVFRTGGYQIDGAVSVSVAVPNSKIFSFEGSFSKQQAAALFVGLHCASSRLFTGSAFCLTAQSFEERLFKEATLMHELGADSDVGFLSVFNFGSEIYAKPRVYAIFIDLILSRAERGRLTFIGCSMPVDACIRQMIEYLVPLIGEKKAMAMTRDFSRSLVAGECR